MSARDPNKLTPTELHAVQALVTAVQNGREDDAKWFVRRPEVLTALAKMRAQAKGSVS